MIAKAPQCSNDVLKSVAAFVCNNQDFLHENFPTSNNPTDVMKALTSRDGWYILTIDTPAAVFKLALTVPTATIDQFCVNDTVPLAEATSKLREELGKLKATNVTVRVPLAEEKAFSAVGFDRRRSYVKFSRTPEETKMMPILPLVNATKKHTQGLSSLMFDAYSKNAHPLPDIATAERMIQSIMSGARGEYVPTASFVSGASQNLVSACLITKNNLGEAVIAELFTHPLYRARGLATTEIAHAMNRLAAAGVRQIVAWNGEDNAVVSRLLTKMGFKENQRVVEMTTQP